MSNENLVFVYGSLKQGYHNHEVISFDFDTHTKNKGYDYLGKAKTVDKFAMYDMGSFPAISFDENGKQVSGELYAVDDATFDLLDTLEGYPEHYNRKLVKLDVDEDIEAWIYFYDPESVDDTMEIINIESDVYEWEY